MRDRVTLLLNQLLKCGQGVRVALAAMHGSVTAVRGAE